MKKSIIIILHAGYWLLYFFLITTFILVMPTGFRHRGIMAIGQAILLSPMTINLILPGLFGFYFFYTMLFSKFLQLKKFPGLVFLGLTVPFVFTFLCMLLSSFLFANDAKMTSSDKLGLLFFSGTLTCIHGTIALIIRGFITWYADIKLKEELTKKNYETELALVKSQINPHFLFNAIHNIDILIMKDGQKASEFLNKLSAIMRFMLYETKTEKIPLQKELGYIENYIELQRIRTSNSGYINYHVRGNPAGLQIAPMLFIPFIENAFKYADGNKNNNTVKINFTITGEQLDFTCENSYSELFAKQTHSGLGNELMRKRLQLMYPQKHALEIINVNRIYKANLTLFFHAD